MVHQLISFVGLFIFNVFWAFELKFIIHKPNIGTSAPKCIETVVCPLPQSLIKISPVSPPFWPFLSPVMLSTIDALADGP